MECSSMFFPIQVKEEPYDDGYDPPPSGLSSYYNSAPHYMSQIPPPSQPSQLSVLHIKQEPGLNDDRLPPGSPSSSAGPPGLLLGQGVENGGVPSPLGGGASVPTSVSSLSMASRGMPPQSIVHGSPPNGATAYPGGPLDPGGLLQPLHMQQPPQQLPPSSKSKKKKKKVKQEPMDEDVSPPHLSMNHTTSNSSSKKRIKQEKITDTFKVRKKVDRFNGMPEEEVIKRTLPDHLATDLDIVIIGINPGLFAAFKGHHYAGPGNHFWKCLYLSGLIPEPMTADDDFRLIEYGIGFTNIVSRTTRGSADLARKEIREGAQILQEKIQKYKPKIAVFNGKGIYEVFSGRKNFDFGKQPDPIEGTNTVIYVMPSSSARCAQLPRAVDKVPFYVALKKLRDHLCGRLPILRESEVCFPDVKLKIESDDGIKTEPAEEDSQDSAAAVVAQARFLACEAGPTEGPFSSPRSALLHSQRNFHQHPLGRAALAAAAAAGGYLEVSLARAGFTSSGSTTSRSSAKSVAADVGGAGGDPNAKKSKSKSKKKKKADGDVGSPLLPVDPKRIKTENGDPGDGQMRAKDPHHHLPQHHHPPQQQQHHHQQHQNSLEGVPCSSPGAQRHLAGGSPLPSDYRSPTPNHPMRPQSQPPPHIQRPSPHPHPLGGFGPPGTAAVAFASQQLSPSSEHSPMYGSPVGSLAPHPGYHHMHPHSHGMSVAPPPQVHVKQEKLDLLDAGRLGSPSAPAGPSSPSLLGAYASPVGCLYNGPNASPGSYGPPPPPQAPPPYFGSPSAPNPYGTYHHPPTLGPPPPHPGLNPHHPLSPHHHSHHALGVGQGGVAQNSTDPYASVARENGIHHPAPTRHHLPPQHPPMSPHEAQYYGGPVPNGPGPGTTPNSAASSGGGSNASSPYSPHKEPSPPISGGAFHQYPSPPAPYHPHLHQLQAVAAAAAVGATTTTGPLPPHQYCQADGGASVFDHPATSPAPLYANLENVKIKQERLDPTYGEY